MLDIVQQNEIRYKRDDVSFRLIPTMLEVFIKFIKNLPVSRIKNTHLFQNFEGSAALGFLGTNRQCLHCLVEKTLSEML